MRDINLTALHSSIEGMEPIEEGRVTAEYWADGAPWPQIDGAEVIFPRRIVIPIVNGDPVSTLALLPTGAVCCVRLEVEDYLTPGPPVVRFVSVPEGSGTIDFGDLEDVDPDSYVRVDPKPTLIQTIESVISSQVEPIVADYLDAHPPVAGFTHSQIVASSSWVISHTLGRLPNVAVYIGGELIETDITASTSTVTITFPSPAAGVAVLN